MASRSSRRPSLWALTREVIRAAAVANSTKRRARPQASLSQASRPHTILPRHFDVVAVALAGLDTSSANSKPSCGLSW